MVTYFSLIRISHYADSNK